MAGTGRRLNVPSTAPEERTNRTWHVVPQVLPGSLAAIVAKPRLTPEEGAFVLHFRQSFSEQELAAILARVMST